MITSLSVNRRPSPAARGLTWFFGKTWLNPIEIGLVSANVLLSVSVPSFAVPSVADGLYPVLPARGVQSAVTFAGKLNVQPIVVNVGA